MSQDELAEKLGVTRQSISLWETGQTQPTLDNIVALAELFGISTDALLTAHEPASSPADAGTVPMKKGKGSVIAAAAVCIALLSALAVTLLLWKNGEPDTEKHDAVISDTAMNEKPAAPAQPQPSGEQETPQEDSTEKPGGAEASQPTAPEKPEQTPAVDVKPQTPPTETEGQGEEKQPEAPKPAESTAAPPEQPAKKDLYSYLKDFVIEKGTVNGDYCYISKPADTYGGYSSEDFSLYYWGDTQKVEFCLHSVLDETFSINFYLYVPKQHTGDYEYISSYYYRDTGAPLFEAKGTLPAKEFTKSYPLNCDKYIGSTEVQNEFMEISREGICDLIACLKEFIAVEQLAYSFADFGFEKF